MVAKQPDRARRFRCRSAEASVTIVIVVRTQPEKAML